jgi:hypothetical protein
VCNTSTGACVTNAGLCTGAPTVLGGKPGTCTNIGSDICCAAGSCFAPASGATSCCPGTSGNTYCQTVLSNTSATCTLENTCTTCEPVSTTTPVYYVDPVNGSDGATGSGAGSDGGAAESCALKTVTRALKLISVVGTALPTKIVIVGGGSATVGAGETFPLVIPTNVSVTTQGGPVTVQVADGKAGFVLSAPASSIASASGALMTITTTVNTGVTPPTGGTNGIWVGGTATSATTTIADVTVTGMLDDGILVTKGSLGIGEGVASTKNGLSTATRAGLHVTGTGAATISVPSGSAPSTFNQNTAHGILVDTSGSISLTGSVTSASSGTGTVVTNQNVAAGVWIEQTPGATAPPQNVITGLVAWGNTAGNGLRIVAGSNVQLRNSALLANKDNGVIVSTGGTSTTPNNDLSHIDLGSGSSNGGNTFQAALGSGNNGGAGICLNVAKNSGVLGAVGNVFSAADCSTTAATLTLNTSGCGNNAGKCASGVCDLGFGSAAAATGNSFDVSMCAQ